MQTIQNRDACLQEAAFKLTNSLQDSFPCVWRTGEPMLQREGIREDFTKGVALRPLYSSRRTTGRGYFRRSEQQHKGMAYGIFREGLIVRHY